MGIHINITRVPLVRSNDEPLSDVPSKVLISVMTPTLCSMVTHEIYLCIDMYECNQV